MKLIFFLRKIIIIYFTTLFFMSNYSYAYSKTIKIAIADDLIPYSFVNKNKKARGLLVDYWKLWSKKTNTEIEFVISSWPETLKSIETNKADIHFGIFYEKDREENLEYLAPIYKVSSHIFINKKDVEKFKSLEDLENKRVAVLFGSFYYIYLKKNYPKIKIKRYHKLNDLLTAIEDFSVDAILNESLTTSYQLLKEVKTFKYTNIESFNFKKYFFATVKKNSFHLKKLVLAGINEITQEEILKIKNRWTMNEIKDSTSKNILSKEEILYLEKNYPIKYSLLENLKNISSYDKNNELKGFNIDLLKLINKNLNTTIEVEIFKNETGAYKSVKNGLTSGVIGLTWSKDKEKYFNYSPIYHNSFFSLDENKETKQIKTISSLDSKNTRLFKEGDLFIGTKKDKKILSSIIKKGIESISKKQMDILNKKWFNKNKSIFTQEELTYIKEKKIIKVGIGDFKPIIYLNNNQLEGVAGKILKQVFKISGLKFDFIKNDWSKLIEDFKKGKIDILPASYFTKNRTKYGLFGDKYLEIKDYIYIEKHNKSIKSFKDLSYKKLAIIKSYGTIDFIKKNFPNIEIIETSSLEESILKVVNKEVDALFDSQINVQNKISQLLITNLKLISQNSVKANSLHIFSKKDDFILKSILNKSLYSISLVEKNKIISSWLNPLPLKKSITVAIKIGKEPFTFEKGPIHGIEYDLIEKIFLKSNIEISRRKSILAEQFEDILATDISIDVLSGVKSKSGDYYYSNDFLSYQNVAVSRVRDNIFINDIKDLKDKKIIAFYEAYKYLGKEYNSLFNPLNRNNNYLEEGKQEIQVKKFLDKKVDVIVLDKNIFIWYLNKLSDDSLTKYKLDYIFPGKNNFQAAFKDKKIRDLFNKNLEIIKKNGEYKDVFFNYLHSDIEAKVKISSLIQATLSRSVYQNNIHELKNILGVFLSLSFIEKIEVFKKDMKETIFKSSENKLDKFLTQDIFFSSAGVPQKVGFLKIYFNEKKLINSSSYSKIIPDLKLFKTLDSYTYIKNIYKKFNYLYKKITFTKKERSFIKNHNNIKYSTLNWEPISIVENEKVFGIMHDYIDIIEEQTGLNFIYEKSNSWKEILEKFNNNEIDFLPKVEALNNDYKGALESKEITDFHFAIVTRDDGYFADELDDIIDKTIALPRGFPNYNYIKKNYPNHKIIETNTMKEALSLVSQGKAYAFVAFSEVAIFNLKNYYPNLKIAGITEDKFIHDFLIQKEYPELESIINKVLLSISRKEKQEIRDKWIRTEINTAIDYRVLYELIAIFCFVLLIILYFVKKLSKAKKNIENANLKLNEEKIKFEMLFNDTSDAIILIKDGKFIEANCAVIELLKYKNKKDLLNTTAGTLAPIYQPDGELSTLKMKRLLAECLEIGTIRFEWQTKDLEGNVFWMEVVATKIVYGKEEISHLLYRNINAKKLLEADIKQRTKDLEITNDELENSNEELQTTIINLKNTQDKLISSEKMAALGGLVAGVAHEINTPIGIGLTGITHLKDSTKDIMISFEKDRLNQEDFTEYLNTAKELSSLIFSNLNKASNLVKSFKHVAVNQSSDEIRVFNIYNYTNEILFSIQSEIRKKDVRVILDCPKDINIKSYPGAFSQVITNLIINSVMHGFKNKNNAEIVIFITKNQNHIKLVYKDNGVGIKKENIKKIFDPFFTTNRDDGGSGLGLNIVYNIVTSTLKGEINCKSTEGFGVEFNISIDSNN